MLSTGEKIKKLRIEKGMTQEELGEKVGIQKSGVAKHENGKIQSIPKETLVSFASALGTTADYLANTLEEDLRALNYNVSRALDHVRVYDEFAPRKAAVFPLDRWEQLCLDSSASFRTVLDTLQKEEPTPVATGDGLSKEKQALIAKIKALSDDDVHRVAIILDQIFPLGGAQ